MRRDMDLIRVIMLKLEDWDKPPGYLLTSPDIGKFSLSRAIPLSK